MALKHITIKGSHYDFGYALGNTLKNAIKRRLLVFLKYRNQNNFQDLKKLHEYYSKKYPRFIDELRGIADGSGQNYWDIFFLNNPQLYYDVNGCTSFVYRSNNKLYLAHNEDGDAWETKNNCILVTYTYNKSRSFTAFVYAGELPGNSYGWNSNHLYCTVNNLPPVSGKKPQYSRYFTGRALLESQTIHGVVSTLRQNKLGDGFHYYVGSGRKIFSFEHTANTIKAIDIQLTNVHTNHALSCPVSKQPLTTKSSIIRYKRTQELTTICDDPLKVLFDVENRPNSIYLKKGDNGRTLSTVIFNPKARKVIVFESNKTKTRKIFSL